MTFTKKILAFMALSLLVQAGIVIVREEPAFATDRKRNTTYTKQKINVNKRQPSAVHIPAPSLSPPLPPSFVVEMPHQDSGIERPPLPLPPRLISKKIILDDSPQWAEPIPRLSVELLRKNIREVEFDGTKIVEKTSKESLAASPIFVSADDYILGAEDKLKITVFGEQELSGEYKIGSSGFVSISLIGAINLTGVSLRQAEQTIKEKFLDGYLKNPSISIEVLESRPFYILGEVKNPGSYPYIHGMNVLQAVAISGGFTSQANHQSVDVLHGKAATSTPSAMSLHHLLRAGDIIFVRERSPSRGKP